MENTAALPSVCVLGGRGMLGSDLVNLLQSRSYKVAARDLPECNITEEADLKMALSNCEICVNCAAFTDVEGAEDAPDTAFAVNAEAVGLLGKLASERGIFVIHISTDFVFDGQLEQPYSETDAPRPLSVYGHSKLKGELALESSGCRHAIVRLQWSYGKAGSHFISKLLKAARTGADLKIVKDQIGAPTWTRDSARAIECLMRGMHPGLFHYANAGYASRFDVASFLAHELNLSNRLIPCATDEFKAKARRPLNSRFDTARVQAILDHPIRLWQDALAEYLREQREPHREAGI